MEIIVTSDYWSITIDSLIYGGQKLQFGSTVSSEFVASPESHLFIHLFGDGAYPIIRIANKPLNVAHDISLYVNNWECPLNHYFL